jgi:hypothetical protein
MHDEVLFRQVCMAHKSIEKEWYRRERMELISTKGSSFHQVQEVLHICLDVVHTVHVCLQTGIVLLCSDFATGGTLEPEHTDTSHL